MANIKVTEYSIEKEHAGVWAQEGQKHDSVMPGGAILDPTAFGVAYIDANTGKKVIPHGTLIGRTYAERDAGTGYGPADVALDEQIFLMTTHITDVEDHNEVQLYRHGRLVAENWLPGYDTMATADLDWIREHYHCFFGND